MKFGGLAKLTLLDYPGKVACTVFTVGCNLRCPFCHNATLVDGYDYQPLTEEQVLDFLAKRKNVLEGMCLTGGEPLINQGVPEFLAKVKAMGYLVKLDTNGTNPTLLKQLVQDNLVDYVAMDIKNSPSTYPQTVGANVDMQAICQSVDFLKSGKVQYEFRTTVTGNLHTEQTIEDIGKWISGAPCWFLQKFVDSGNLIDVFSSGCDDETMRKYLAIARKYVANAQLRGLTE